MCLCCERAGSAVVRSQCAKRPVGSSTPDLAPGHSPHNIILFSLHVISSGCLSRMEPQKECDASVAYGVIRWSQNGRGSGLLVGVGLFCTCVVSVLCGCPYMYEQILHLHISRWEVQKKHGRGNVCYWSPQQTCISSSQHYWLIKHWFEIVEGY